MKKLLAIALMLLSLAQIARAEEKYDVYIFVCGNPGSTFYEVVQKMKDGWRLHGAPFNKPREAYDTIVCQAMVKSVNRRK